jgi:hypothetical protein
MYVYVSKLKYKIVILYFCCCVILPFTNTFSIPDNTPVFTLFSLIALVRFNANVFPELLSYEKYWRRDRW